MIPFSWFSAYKNKWIKDREAKLQLEFKSREEELCLKADSEYLSTQSVIKIKQDNLNDLMDTLDKEQSRQNELIVKTKSKNEELEFRISEIKLNHEDRVKKMNSDNDLEVQELKSKLMQDKEKVKSQMLLVNHEGEKYRLRELEIQELNKRISDRKSELEQTNRELKEQIRLIEAKAKPDSIWISAFQSGFSKACESLPILKDGIEKVKEVIKQDAIDSTISNLEGVISKRIDKAGLVHIKSNNNVLAKREQFVKLRDTSKTEQDKTKFSAYISTLDWVLNGDVLQKDKS